MCCTQKNLMILKKIIEKIELSVKVFFIHLQILSLLKILLFI